LFLTSPTSPTGVVVVHDQRRWCCSSESRIHVGFVVVADVDDIITPFCSSRKGLKANISGGSVAAKPTTWISFFFLRKACLIPVSIGAVLPREQKRWET